MSTFSKMLRFSSDPSTIISLGITLILMGFIYRLLVKEQNPQGNVADNDGINQPNPQGNVADNDGINQPNPLPPIFVMGENGVFYRFRSYVDGNNIHDQFMVLDAPEPLRSLRNIRLLDSINGILCFYGDHLPSNTRMAVMWNPSAGRCVGIRVIPKEGYTYTVVGFGVCPVNGPKLVKISVKVNDDGRLVLRSMIKVKIIQKLRGLRGLLCGILVLGNVFVLLLSLKRGICILLLVLGSLSLLRLVLRSRIMLDVDVFTLSTHVWTNVYPYAPFILCNLVSAKVCLNGVIYFRAFEGRAERENFFISFDLKSDKFGKVPLPSGLVNTTDYLEAAKVDGSLGLLQYHDGVCHVWIKEEGANETFIRIHIVTVENRRFNGDVLGFVNNGEAVVLELRDGVNPRARIVVYDPFYGRIEVLFDKAVRRSFSMRWYINDLTTLIDEPASIIY